MITAAGILHKSGVGLEHVRMIPLLEPLVGSLAILAFVFGMCLISLVVPVFQRAPVWVMLVSQALGTIIFPTTVVCLAYLLNRKDVMGNNVNSISANVSLFFVIAFAFAMAGVGVYRLVS